MKTKLVIYFNIINKNNNMVLLAHYTCKTYKFSNILLES